MYRYEDASLVEMYLGLHYPASGAKEGVAPVIAHATSPDHAVRFPQRVATLLADLKPTK